MSFRSNSCCGSNDVAASHSQTAVAAAGTLRRHTLRLLLRQQGRCGVTLSDCCCGSRDVAASHSHTAVAAAETLRRQVVRWTRIELATAPAAVTAAARQYSSAGSKRCDITFVCCSWAFVVPAPVWCAAPASATGYILQGVTQKDASETCLW